MAKNPYDKVVYFSFMLHVTYRMHLASFQSLDLFKIEVMAYGGITKEAKNLPLPLEYVDMYHKSLLFIEKEMNRGLTGRVKEEKRKKVWDTIAKKINKAPEELHKLKEAKSNHPFFKSYTSYKEPK